MWDHPASPQATTRTPLEEMAAYALRVSQICDLLEAMADDLPRRPAPVWREATRMCDEVVRDHYAILLDVLLPVLSNRIGGEPDCKNVLHRLNADFEEEASKLSELTSLMTDAVGSSTDQIGSETLGYALRCFFSALRRNAAWETDVLLPLAKQRLCPDDLDTVSQLMRLKPMVRNS